MDNEKVLVFSAQYEKPELKPPHIERTPEEDKVLSQKFQEILREVREESTYEPWPEREETAKKLIELAESYSRESETDTEIFRDQGEIIVNFYYTLGRFLGEGKSRLAEMMLLADEVNINSLSIPTPDWCSLMIQLTLYTRRFLVGGIQLIP